LVGEMRDKETAEIAIKLANTGHLTFSTLHTNDAPSAVSRLFKMGIEPFLLAYAINIIVAQRLIRKLCEQCKKPVKSFDKELALAAGMTKKQIEETTFYEAVGCPICLNTGFKGRMAIHEALYFSKEIRKLIVGAGSDIDEEALRVQAKKDNMLTLRESGFIRVQNGLTSFEEVVSSTTED
ncbi:MAG: Flp pilus assembly complex ATPase component TadA, partial [Bacteroidetes bacterium]|nr:Flp pilus assembly complex ATPase component TadA [Bacteroidota bacterium]